MEKQKNNRVNILNYLIKKYKYKKYLEIGCGRDRKTIDNINCKYKTGVDPRFKCDYKMTSDVFFKQLSKEKIYDIIFIDGLHLYKQILKDVKNSLKHINKKGIIVLHDCNPKNEKRQLEIKKKWGPWNGSTWKTIVILRMTKPKLFITTINADQGLGIIKKGHQKLFKYTPENELTYDFLVKNRKELLNLISEKEFYNQF